MKSITHKLLVILITLLLTTIPILSTMQRTNRCSNLNRYLQIKILKKEIEIKIKDILEKNKIIVKKHIRSKSL